MGLIYTILSACLILLMGWPTLAEAQEPAVNDSSQTAAYPSRVGHRSTGETLLALPGMVVYLPFKGVFFVMERTANAIWEKRVIDRFNSWFTTRDGRTGIRPLANTANGTGIRLFRNRGLFGGDVSFATQYGVQFRQNHLLTLSWPAGRLFSGSFIFTGLYRTRTVEKFYGIGNNSPFSARTDFLEEDGLLRFAYASPFERNIGIGLELDYRMTDIRGGEVGGLPDIDRTFTPGQVAGLGDRAHFIALGISTRLRFVDIPGSPTRGNISRFRVGYHQAIDDDALSHLSLSAETEQFFELFYGRTLSVKVATDWRAAPIGSNRVPFYNLASLGGEQVLLGYERGRFRDRGMVYAAATYKFPIWAFWDGLIFYERGRTLNHPDDFTFSGWKNTIGGGFRIWKRNRTLFNFLVARSEQQIRIIFTFNTGT